MNLIQRVRRLGQKSGWNKRMSSQDSQQDIIKKLYAKNGLEIKMTCSAHPEQYDVFKGGKQVAYYRLRHGEFTVDYPDCMAENILQAQPNGDGIFDDDERLNYLTQAMRVVLERIKTGNELTLQS